MAQVTDQIDDPDSKLWSYRGGSLHGFKVVSMGTDTSNGNGTITFWLEKGNDSSTAVARLSLTFPIRDMARAYKLQIKEVADIILGVQ
jgi:hypothetical protein